MRLPPRGLCTLLRWEKDAAVPHMVRTAMMQVDYVWLVRACASPWDSHVVPHESGFGVLAGGPLC